MAKFADLTGQKFGRLTVLEKAEDYISPKGQKQVQWLCECSCENKTQIIITGNKLKNKHTQSCGCLKKEQTLKVHKKYNQYDLSGEYGIGYTSKGEEFWFDLEDYKKIKDYCWCFDNDGYVVARIPNSHNKLIKLHKLLLPSNYKVIDHRNHKTYDNRKINLRCCEIKENTRNQKVRVDNISGVTGVSFCKSRNKWVAYIYVDKKRICLGYFYIFEDAIKARKDAENKYFGEFSYDNSIKGGDNHVQAK